MTCNCICQLMGIRVGRETGCMSPTQTMQRGNIGLSISLHNFANTFARLTFLIGAMVM